MAHKTLRIKLKIELYKLKTDVTKVTTYLVAVTATAIRSRPLHYKEPARIVYWYYTCYVFVLRITMFTM
jgi:hypothetical protein